MTERSDSKTKVANALVAAIEVFSDSVMGTWNATYDTLNRIASATAIAGSYSSAVLSWTIDPFGNRTAQTVSGHPMPLYFSETEHLFH